MRDRRARRRRDAAVRDASMNRLLSTCATRLAESRLPQLGDDLAVELIELAPARASVRGSNDATSVKRESRCQLRDVGTGREMHLERGMPRVDHVVAGGAGTERLLGAHVEPAPVELVQQPETGRADRLRVGEPRDEIRAAPAARLQLRRARCAVGPDQRAQRLVEARRLHGDTRRLEREHHRRHHRDRREHQRADARRWFATVAASQSRRRLRRRRCSARTDELDRGPADREQHQRDEPPRPEQQVEPDGSEDARRGDEPERERDDEHSRRASNSSAMPEPPRDHHRRRERRRGATHPGSANR